MNTRPDATARFAEEMEARGQRIVIFHRADQFYALELPFNDDWAAHAKANPGTLKVTDALTNKVLWVAA